MPRAPLLRAAVYNVAYRYATRAHERPVRSRGLPLRPSPHPGRLGSRPARDPLPSAPKRALRHAAGLRITLLLGGDREVDVDLAIVGPLAGLHERAQREAIGTARGLRAG